MFSLTEWIMKGAIWSVLLLFVFLGYRRWSRGVTGGRGGVQGCDDCISHIAESDGVTFHPEYGVPVYRLKSLQAGGA